jgi:hypothetical protein
MRADLVGGRVMHQQASGYVEVLEVLVALSPVRGMRARISGRACTISSNCSTICGSAGISSSRFRIGLDA